MSISGCQWDGPPFADRKRKEKKRSDVITPSIIPGPLFSILSHAAATTQREGGALFDVPAQMLNDSDTKRGPPHRSWQGSFPWRERLGLTFYFLKGSQSDYGGSLDTSLPGFKVAISLAVTTLIPLEMTRLTNADWCLPSIIRVVLCYSCCRDLIFSQHLLIEMLYRNIYFDVNMTADTLAFKIRCDYHFCNLFSAVGCHSHWISNPQKI